VKHLAYQYHFRKDVPITDVLDTLDLAVIAVESIHGEARASLETSWSADAASRMVTIDATNEVGRTLNQVFVGFIRREYGRTHFTVTASLRSIHARPPEEAISA
jgi:hypothetical protein